ncbi:hypothetical protein [Thermaerobacillus caldiproteolyticus]|uniref:hypothetical protein n=1 Tax=Thermaerobacillus caldiproteolyticus TaxID=247480 RepID=UPI001F17DAF0|nr:hypothetical protein [Anoxybacillus caldiproteolyticus]
MALINIRDYCQDSGDWHWLLSECAFFLLTIDQFHRYIDIEQLARNEHVVVHIVEKMLTHWPEVQKDNMEHVAEHINQEARKVSIIGERNVR